VVGPIGSVGRSIVTEQLAVDSRVEPQTVGSLLDALLLAGRIQASRSIERFEVRRPDLIGLLPTVAAPVLLLAGDAGSPWPVAQANEVAALSPFAQVVEVPRTRHQVPLDRPEAFSAAVRRFWAGLESPG
jgi:pimeloyl-ACP methyl ester carboxylesterase